MRIETSFLSGAISVALVACGGDANDGANTNNGADAAADSPDAGESLGPCPAKTLCLTPFLIEPEKAQQAGRLTVVWFQVMDLPPNTGPATHVAYDVPFEPGRSRYDIPLAEISAPPATPTLLCQWESGVCQTNANPTPLGLGLPLVLDDANGNGKIDSAEVGLYRNHGVGMVYLGWSASGASPGSVQLGINKDILPSGIQAGVHYYAPDDLFDASLGQADTGGPFDLALCPSAGNSCQVVGPTLKRADYP